MVLTRQQIWYRANRELTKARAAAWIKNNPGRRKEILHTYNTSEACLAQRRIRSKREDVKALRRVKRKSYVNSAIADKNRTLIRVSLKRVGLKKTLKTERLVGCTLPQLRLHLESNFKPGMSWENHGDWHIDHKRPCASFNLQDIEQQKACFHFTNLQPLWAPENISKGDTWIGY